MSSFTFTLVLVLYFLLLLVNSSEIKEFSIYLQKFNKESISETPVFHKKYQNYKTNFEFQRFLNGTHKHLSAYYGPTKFSDLSPEEFKDQYLSDLKVSRKTKDENQHHTPSNFFRRLDIPKRVDWRNFSNINFVTPVKNQKKCGGCWAFSATETIESMKAIQTGLPPPRLSVQEVIDCATYNDGCSGGDPYRAVKWLKDTQSPLTTEKKYPLTDTSDSCRIIVNNSDGVIVKSGNFQRLVGREDKILLLLNTSPVSVAVDATTWNNYLGGIIQYHCETHINHAVQIVGYDISGDVPYYIVRNSWGTDYGHKGYLYIKIGENLCGIAEEVTTVTVQ
nr:cathepsin O [Mytilus galloprovincialis]